MSRTTGGTAPLDPSGVVRFFGRRAEVFDSAHPLVSVLYQDSRPQLAEERDAHEKRVVTPLLALGPGSRVLDIGCGVGRWAPAVTATGASYVGTDFSEALLDHARELHPGVEFHHLAATATASLAEDAGFTHVLVAGVTMYLGDEEYVEALSQCALVCAAEALVYLRESVSLERRLTLSAEWSEEMSTEYHAIYRTAEEGHGLASRALAPAGFTRVTTGPLYPDHLNNRPDTRQEISLWRR